MAALQGRKPEGGNVPLLLQKFMVQCQERGLAAKVIVEYDRKPYVFGPGNVRVTLDQGIRSSRQTRRFLEQDFVRRPVQAMGEHVLEVKYDDFLPDAVAQALRLETLRRTSFSKYYLCRRYG